jgi:preprotein translocase subunit SecF
MYDIVGKRKLWFAISALLTLPGLLFIFLGGLRPSIDFTGGTEWEVRYAEEPTAGEVEAFLVDAGYDDPLVIALDDGFLRIRTEPIDLIPPERAAPSVAPSPTDGPGASPDPSVSPDASADPSASAEPSGTPEPTEAPVVATGTPFAELHDELEAEFGAGAPRSVRTVGPIIGADLIRSSIILIVVGELFILAYLWIRFGFRFGTAAIVALLHDVILVVGAFAILGFFFNFEFDALFVTALLTVIGFSVHDTIVIFDRIRENKARHLGEPFADIVNHALLQTFGRSITTSFTTILVLLAIWLFGGAAINDFILALIIGIAAGAYSSIFVAAPMLVDWHAWDDRRHGRVATGRAPRARRAAS